MAGHGRRTHLNERRDQLDGSPHLVESHSACSSAIVLFASRPCLAKARIHRSVMLMLLGVWWGSVVGVRHVIPAAWLVFAGRATRIPHCPNHVPYGYGSLDVRSETPAAPVRRRRAPRRDTIRGRSVNVNKRRRASRNTNITHRPSPSFRSLTVARAALA